MKLGSKEVELLLRSGIPLELSGNRLLAEKDYWVEPDFGYLREGKDFSIDAVARLINNSLQGSFSSVWLDLLVEYKFNAPGSQKWVFFPYNSKVKRHHRSSLFSIPLKGGYDYRSRLRMSDRNIFQNNPNAQKFFLRTPIVWKGVSLMEKEVTPSFIKEGVSQLQYAYANKLMDIVEFNFPDYYLEDREYLIAPILVTNNPLYVTESGLELDKILESKKVKLKRVGWVLLNSDVGRQASEYSYGIFLESFKKMMEKKEQFYAGIYDPKTYSEKVKKFQKDYLPKIISNLQSEPNKIWVVEYGRLEDFLDTLLKVFGGKPKVK